MSKKEIKRLAKFLLNRSMGSTHASVVWRTSIVRAIARGVNSSLSDYLTQNSQFIPKLAGRLTDSLFWAIADSAIGAWIDKCLQAVSGTPIVIEHALLQEMRSVIETISTSRTALSAVYILHGEPGTGKSYAASVLGCIVPHELIPSSGDTILKAQHPLKQSETSLGVSKYLIDEVDLLIQDDPKFLAKLLRFLDKHRQEKSFIVITTNNLSSLPPKLLRKGRVSKVVEVSPWTKEVAMEFCQKYDMTFSEAPSRNQKYYAGDLIEWYQNAAFAKMGLSQHFQISEEAND